MDVTKIDISKTSPEEVVEMLRYASYCIQRDDGLTHEQLIKLEFPNEYGERYDKENNNK